MPKFESTTALNFTMPDGQVIMIKKGENDIPQEAIDDFFVNAHSTAVAKGRMPLVEGADGMMIEADEAGQRVGPAPFMNDAGAPPVRQEGPFSHQQVNRDAPASAMDGTPVPAGVKPVREVTTDSDLQAANARLEATRLANPRPVPK